MALSFLLIITTSVFCVVLIVMLAVRPGVFRLLVREFTSNNATLNKESQEQTNVNWKKGIFRLTLVFSVLFGIFAAFINSEIQNSYIDFLENFFIFFALTWIIYFAIGFVIRGFASKE